MCIYINTAVHVDAKFDQKLPLDETRGYLDIKFEKNQSRHQSSSFYDVIDHHFKINVHKLNFGQKNLLSEFKSGRLIILYGEALGTP